MINTFYGDNHDIERWLDFFVKKHIAEIYTFDKYWEHWHPPIADLVLPANNYIFIKYLLAEHSNSLTRMSIIFDNEDGDTWQFQSPVTAVTPAGVIHYSGFEKIENVVISGFNSVANIDFLQIIGYLITAK